MDLVVRGRLALPDGRLERASLGIERGRVAAVARDLDADGTRVIDVGDALVLPGAVDAHVHFRDPGHPEKEDFRSGTTAAAFGGVTAVLDMPNTNPPTLTVEAFEAKLASVAPKALVDFGLFAGLSSPLPPDFEALIDRATALKTYLGASTGNLLVRDPAVVARGIEVCAARGKVAAFHAESEGCLEAHAHHYEEAEEQDYAAHARARPPICEAEAIEMLKGLPRPPGSRVHICHLSTLAGLQELEGGGFTSEVTPHHLFLNTENLRRGGGAFKMNPPLREDLDRESLWQALAGGAVDMVATDHAPHTREEKRLGVHVCPAGVPGVETMMPLLLAQALQGRISLARLVEATCRRPADVYGLPKGRFALGYDADFAVYDPKAVAPIREEQLHSRAGWTPYEGMDALFPTQVYLRGEPVVADGVLVGKPGRGRFLPGAERDVPTPEA